MKLYKHNKIANEYELTPAEIAGLFMASQEYQDWLDDSGWPLDRHVISFISGGGPEGLHSVPDCDEDGRWTIETDQHMAEINKIIRERSRS